MQGLHQKVADLELCLRSEVTRGSLLQLSTSVAEEVIEQASAAVTPLLRQRAEERRPATSPAAPAAWEADSRPSPWAAELFPVTHAERVAEVAAEMAREVVHAVLTNLEGAWRDTPSPQL